MKENEKHLAKLKCFLLEILRLQKKIRETGWAYMFILVSKAFC